jgi:hypothetical protein
VFGPRKDESGEKRESFGGWRTGMKCLDHERTKAAKNAKVLVVGGRVYYLVKAELMD